MPALVEALPHDLQERPVHSLILRNLPRSGVCLPPGRADREINMRVLVIEDDRASQELARRVIAALGHDVLVASDGPEGLEVLARERPDALVVDMRLPTMNGWIVAAEARRAFPRLRIVGVSAGLADERERAVAAGCDSFVEKPYDLKALRAAIS